MGEEVLVKIIETANGKIYDIQYRDSSGDSINRQHPHNRRASRQAKRSQCKSLNKHERKNSRSKRHSRSSISDHTGDVAPRHSKSRHQNRSSRNSYSSGDISLSSSRRSHNHKKSSLESKSRHSDKEHSHQDNRRGYSKFLSLTTFSSSSSEDNHVSDAQYGNRLEALNGFARVQEEGEEVEYVDFQKSKRKGFFESIPMKYKLVAVPLLATLFAFAFFLVLRRIKYTESIQSADNVFAMTTEGPTNRPTKAPTATPFPLAARNPTPRPTTSALTLTTSVTPSLVTNSPTNRPTKAPTPTLFPLATRDPTPRPTISAPTLTTSATPSLVMNAPSEGVVATYIPGKLTVRSNGLLLSEGLRSRIVATSGKPVTLTGNVHQNQSEVDFHKKPDGAAIFPWFETGGWVYVSNSEVADKGKGGVGAIYFDKDGNVLDYQRLLDGTTMNCGGGPTPWGTWVTCEEIDGGKALQVDPFGIRPAQQLSTVGTGFFESFAYDIRNPQEPAFYITEDKQRGPLRRVIPNNPDWDDPWEILHGMGTLEYLVLEPNAEDNGKSGSYYWTTERKAAKVNSQRYYKHSEGIDVHNDQLFFVSKVQKELFILNLDLLTYEVHTTVSGIFEGEPDQVKRLIRDGLLYFCEEGGKENGVHARDENGWFFTILESETLRDETTGLAFSPDGMHMYVSYQHNGLIFDVWRDDNLPFHARTLNVKYHEIQ